MKKFLLALSVISLVIIFSSIAFANTEDEARDALIIYSGTEAFANLLPEERRACMSWLAQGGYMNELCRSAVTRLISDDPDAVSPSQRRALLRVASGKSVSSSSTPTSSGGTVIRESDNTGSLIAAGIVGVIAGMVIHNNLPRDRGRDIVCYPAPPRYHRPLHYKPIPHYKPAPHYRPAPHRPAPHYKVESHYRVEPHYHVHINNKHTSMKPHSPVRHAPAPRAPQHSPGPRRR